MRESGLWDILSRCWAVSSWWTMWYRTVRLVWPLKERWRTARSAGMKSQGPSAARCFWAIPGKMRSVEMRLIIPISMGFIWTADAKRIRWLEIRWMAIRIMEFISATASELRYRRTRWRIIGHVRSWSHGRVKILWWAVIRYAARRRRQSLWIIPAIGRE